MDQVTNTPAFRDESTARGKATAGKFEGKDWIIMNSVSLFKSTIARICIPAFFFLCLINGRPLAAGVIQVEAETGVLNGLSIAMSIQGYSGTGYVWEFDKETDNLTLKIETTRAGLYELSIRYTSPYGEKGYNLEVNDMPHSGMFEETGNAFQTATAGNFYLKEGENTVKIIYGWGYYGIDFIAVKPATVRKPEKPPFELTLSAPTLSTESLFGYLLDVYGEKVLSSQEDDVDYILDVTGKEPAIGAFDLMEYSGSRIAHGADTAGISERIIDWALKDEGRGIITLMWHWNAPADLINEAPDKLWWSGFYTRATTFDIQSVLADKEGERYQMALRDIDIIAHELKKFADADIPVLWRPLHEAPGGWFWWGAKGPEPFKALWRLLYDRLVNHHKLRNLIWVYTATTDMAWYPGDEYVDIVGLDIYADAGATFSGDWDSMLELFDGRKMIALSETGNPPDPDHIRLYGTWWSWFAVWTGDFIKNQPDEFLNRIYHDEDIITRDELPDWRVYTYEEGKGNDDKATGLGESQPVDFRLHPNPAQKWLNLLLTARKYTRARISLFNAAMQKTLYLARQLQPGENQIEINMENLPAGIYILRIDSDDINLSRKIILRRRES